jgi:hypothetical protein
VERKYCAWEWESRKVERNNFTDDGKRTMFTVHAGTEGKYCTVPEEKLFLAQSIQSGDVAMYLVESGEVNSVPDRE